MQPTGAIEGFTSHYLIIKSSFKALLLMVYRVSKKTLTALKSKLVAPNPIGTKHIK